MKAETFVVEDGNLPVVFSASPDSPASPFLVQRRLSSLEEMHDAGFIPPTVALEHLNEAREIAQRVSFPGLVNLGPEQWVSDHPISGLTTVPRRAAIAREVVHETAAHLERVGHSSVLANVVAKRIVEIISPAGDGHLIINQIEFGDLNLDVRGILYIHRNILSLQAMNVIFHWGGWIVPQGSHFFLTCNKVEGVNDMPDLKVRHDQIVQDISGITKPGPIEGWTDRLPIDEIQNRATQVMENWQ
ncbi:hypothetical protein EEB14_49445 [Rhodococcus sp. WS4]|nr:hypothetical protein EEB14_49445 [Rhodococcus sp. WS4]